MPRLYLITVPGLDVRRHWAPVHDRLLDDFPQITDVLATTIAATLLIVYQGEVDVDAWLASISEGVLSVELTAPRPEIHRRWSREPSVGPNRTNSGSPPGPRHHEAETDGHIIHSIK